MIRWFGKVQGFGNGFKVVAELMTRLTVGFVFVQSGYGKLTHLEKTVEFFVSLGVPQAQLQAPFVAVTELACGMLLLIGLATRLAAVPAIVIMVVAIRAAKWEDITDLSSLLGTSEFLYIILLAWLIAVGSGKLSLDALMRRKFCGGSCA